MSPRRARGPTRVRAARVSSDVKVSAPQFGVSHPHRNVKTPKRPFLAAVARRRGASGKSCANRVRGQAPQFGTYTLAQASIADT
jgi:hypothetical protein